MGSLLRASAGKHGAIVFLPGIMGSQLFYNGPGDQGAPVREEVWSGDISTLITSLDKEPARLRSSYPLEVGEVIRHLRFGKLEFHSLYDDLVRGLEKKLGCVANKDLHLFPYDWRQSNRDTAALLAAFLESLLSESSAPITLVGYSMGGLVIRLLMADKAYAKIHARISKQILVASPGRGAATAYRTIKAKPSLHPFIDRYLNISHGFNHALDIAFIDAIASFDSLMELLPPDSEHTIVDRTGNHWPALAPELWPGVDPARILKAKQVHLDAYCEQNSNTWAIYSTATKTPIDYVVDRFFQLQAEGGRLANGDGEVVQASALLGIHKDRRHHIPGEVSHSAVPDHPDTCKAIANLIATAPF